MGCADGGGTDVCSMTVEVARNDGGAGGGGGKVGTGARCWLVIDAGSRHWHKVRGVVLSHGVGGGSGGEVGGATGAHLQGWRWERANMNIARSMAVGGVRHAGDAAFGSDWWC